MIVLEIHRGDDRIFELEVFDRKTKDPIPITGSTIKITIRKTPNDVIFLQKTFTPTDPANGLAQVKFAASDTSSLENKKQEFVFDVEAVKVDTSKETLCSGKFTVLPEVTYT